MKLELTKEQSEKRKQRFEQWEAMIKERAKAGCEVVQLWPEGAPGFDASFEQEQPRLILYPAREQ
jgi:hypothetical protein